MLPPPMRGRQYWSSSISAKSFGQWAVTGSSNGRSRCGPASSRISAPISITELLRYQSPGLSGRNWMTERDARSVIQVRKLHDFRPAPQRPGDFLFDREDRSEEHTSELQSLRHLVC